MGQSIAWAEQIAPWIILIVAVTVVSLGWVAWRVIARRDPITRSDDRWARRHRADLSGLDRLDGVGRR